MAAPASVDEYLDLVRKSGVADEKRLEGYVQRLRASCSLPREAVAMAGMLVRDGILTQFQAEQILQGKWRRFTIGKYKVLEKLGAGGMGSVYLCEHKLMRRRVAVKILPAAKGEDPASLERFHREARAAAQLDHPNIVHAYDIDQEDKLHFLVMEYVDGSNLQDVVKKSGPLVLARACHYIRQAALGLQHAFEKGLVHRDMKPGNVLVDRQGVVKILDMGLARFFHDEDDILTRKYDESVLGTADYLAPEQAIDSHTADIRADIYGLGATFYFLLAGRPPFEGGTVAQKLLWHQTKTPRSLTEFRQDVPAGVLAIIAKMMAKDPAQRYATPGEAAAALEPFTRTIVAPPTEAEMPQLSPAATRGLVPDGADTTVVRQDATTPRTPVPVAAPSSARRPVPPAPRAVPSAPVATAPVAPPRPQPPRSAPAVARTAEPVVDEPAPWERAAADTGAAVDTDSLTESARRLPLLDPRVKEQERRRLWFVLLVVGIPFLLGVSTLLVLYFPWPGRTGGPKVRPKLVITKAGAAGTFRSVGQAIQHARAGDVLELADAVHEENLDLGTAMTLPRGLTVQAAEGVSVQWVPKNPARPILTLRKAESFRIKGERITLDGDAGPRGKVKDLVHIMLLSPGLTLEDLTLKNYTQRAIAIYNAQGTAPRPIRLHNLTIVGASDKKPALALEAAETVIPRFNDYIEVTDLHTEGIDPVRAIRVEDPAPGKHVRLPGTK